MFMRFSFHRIDGLGQQFDDVADAKPPFQAGDFSGILEPREFVGTGNGERIGAG